VVRAPQTGYAQTSDGSYVAFETRGDGPLDLLEVSNGTLFSFTCAVEQPAWIDYVERLASFSRLIRCDPRGIGLSDPLPGGASTAESYADEIIAVLDGAGSESATLVGATYAGAGAILAAATHPERVHALVLINSYARLARSDDYPIGIPTRLLDMLRDATQPEVDRAGMPGAAGDLPLMAPSLVGVDGIDRWWVEAGRRGASPTSARSIIAAFVELDVRSVLSEVRVPTLVLHARDNRFVRPNLGRYIADHIAGATYVELPCADHVPWANGELYAGEIEEFLTGARRVDLSHRVLATVLFTDIVDSTRRAVELGDEHWRTVLDRHDLLSQREINRFGGRFVKSTGDGLLATFDAPGRAIRAAAALREAAAGIGVDIRAGLHVGEIELRGDDVAGVAVHVAARVAAAAGAGEILVSSTVRELVAGSGLDFEDRGMHELKGVPGPWHLHAIPPERPAQQP
jgi:class 3 adenylate cyclase/pimeloyl-ACP methyl ester carboxylesterase